MLSDPRLIQYAELLVNRCIGVRPGWQVHIRSTPLARPLLEEVVRLVAAAGAYPLAELSFETLGRIELEAAPLERLQTLAPLRAEILSQVDAFISIDAPENRRSMAGLDPLRLAARHKAQQPYMKRVSDLEVPWVACQYPTPALAQDADLDLAGYEELIYAACLLDWDAAGREMSRIKACFDAVAEVRLVAAGTDLRLGLHGRPGIVDDGHYNMPGGEVFYCPVEDAVDGVVQFEYPAVWGGQSVEGVCLHFRQGRVVEASATGNEPFLLSVLDTDAGARVLGELGIGCNTGITRYMKNILFDEKIAGTVHLALGNGFPVAGGRNVSAVHWDMVKDLRQGGRLYADGRLVQEDGRWLI